jgi:hypothetical protein
LLDDLGDRRGYSHLKEEALDRIKWRNRFGRGFGPVVWQITDDDDDDDDDDDGDDDIGKEWGTEFNTNAIIYKNDICFYSSISSTSNIF